MPRDALKLLKKHVSAEELEKLSALGNPALNEFVLDAVKLCAPASVFVCTDSDEDVAWVREQAVKAREEHALKTRGHTVHWDGVHDQGRDKAHTRYLLPKGVSLGKHLNSIEKDKGLREVRRLLKGSMNGREMIVRFFCLGPTDSPFSISGAQMTDSFYVGHSEDLLYRGGYEQFKKLEAGQDFFRVLHSSGRLEKGVSADPDKRRIYIDLEDETVYSVNTQYAGNTVGFKKLSLRLAIQKADREGWLAEHMFVMGVNGPKGRKTYFTGAYPSYCGKTSTSMMKGETIIGDDLAYLRRIGSEVRTVNVESGIFGIIRGVNEEDDPILWDVLHSPGEVIFSNVMVSNGRPYWQGCGKRIPKTGVNYTGKWHEGKKDRSGNEVPPSHANARYTVRLADLENVDPELDNPEGVPVGGVIYGGRDPDTWVPVQEALSWRHGVITMGASLESLTTAATLGKQGVRAFQPMANMDFVSIPLGRYIQNHLDFVKGLRNRPLVFAVNYFLSNAEGKYLNDITDKGIWLKWMELRVHGDVGALETPTGLIPKYEDLASLFKSVQGKTYTKEQYEEQFKLRIPELLYKLHRIGHTFRSKVPDAPKALFDELRRQERRLLKLRDAKGYYLSPSEFPQAK
jgi:phosphoenolpyruvate carboxykinase (GTP)